MKHPEYINEIWHIPKLFHINLGLTVLNDHFFSQKRSDRSTSRAWVTVDYVYELNRCAEVALSKHPGYIKPKIKLTS